MAETSTGAWQQVREIAQLAHEHEALIIIVDAVTGLGGLPIETDAWDLDCVYSGTQKCLSCPPGLAPITFGPRAAAKIKARTTKVASWYLDMSMIAQYWGKIVSIITRADQHDVCLGRGTEVDLNEGLPNCHARHLLNHRALKAGLTALNISYTAAEIHNANA